MFQIEHILKKKDKHFTLYAEDLVTPVDQTTVVLGASGSGKSTLLQLMVGLIIPDKGAVYFQKELVEKKSLLKIRRNIGYVTQDSGLFPHLTNYENIVLMAKQLKWDKEKIRKRVKDLVQLTHLPGECLKLYPMQISLGERQRVGLMRALMLDPRALLLDEPLGALDPITRNQLQQDLKIIFQRLNKTVVLITHDLQEAKYLGDFFVLMNKGRILQKGLFYDLYKEPKDPYVSKFIKHKSNATQESTLSYV